MPGLLYRRWAICCSTVELLPHKWWRRVESNHLIACKALSAGYVWRRVEESNLPVLPVHPSSNRVADHSAVLSRLCFRLSMSCFSLVLTWRKTQESNPLRFYTRPLSRRLATIGLSSLAERKGIEPSGLLHPLAFQASTENQHLSPLQGGCSGIRTRQMSCLPCRLRHPISQLLRPILRNRRDSNPRGFYTHSVSNRAP